MKFLIVIGGATATGKSALALALARHFQTEILSADSRQMYREMTIGTAKPASAELRAVKHHFVDSLTLDRPYSAGDFEREALALLNQLYRDRDIAILVGGSGLFIQAVCQGLDTFPAISPATKKWVQDGEHSGGLQWLQQQLEALDPECYRKIDRNNPARLRRALEVCRESNRPYSAFLNREKPERPFLPVYILLDLPRQELYERIDRRVDEMVAAGLEAEARSLTAFKHLSPLRTVGYQEWFPYFEGKISREDVIDRIKQHSRNYAKRQITWFKKYGEWRLFHPTETAAIIRHIEQKRSQP